MHMTPLFVSTWYWFGEHACMREGIEGDANLERLLLGGHPDNFGHESLQQFFLTRWIWYALANAA